MSIQLWGAQQVAAIEGQVFNIQGSEYDIARRRAELEIQTARVQVEKWRQTAALIGAINNGVFEPPPGFPAIRVQIGSIIIDNRDQSQTTTPPTQPPRTPREPRDPGDRPGRGGRSGDDSWGRQGYGYAY